MNSFAIFKESLKSLKTYLQSDLNILKKQLEEIDRVLWILNNHQNINPSLKMPSLETESIVDFKQTLENEKEQIQTECDFKSFILKETIATINAFSNDKAVNIIANPGTLFFQCFSAYELSLIGLAAASQILGSAWVFNVTHAKQAQKTPAARSEVIIQLADYYTPYGTFKIAKSQESLIPLYHRLIDSSDMLKHYYEETKEFGAIDEFIIQMQNIYDIFKSQSVTPDIVEKTDAFATINRADIEMLRKYYKNGDLIKVPENLSEFYKLLSRCRIDEKEQSYIRSLIKKACKTNKKSIPAGEVVPLKETSINNLIFLKSEDGESYFSKDIKNLEKLELKRLNLAISKLLPEYKYKFRKVISEFDTDLKVFMYRDKTIHILFVEIELGIYLILGVATDNKMLHECVKRYYDLRNQEYINAVKVALKDPINREKVLTDNSLELMSGVNLERRKPKEGK